MDSSAVQHLSVAGFRVVVKTEAAATRMQWRLLAEETKFMNKAIGVTSPATPLTQRYTVTPKDANLSHTSSRLGSGLCSSHLLLESYACGVVNRNTIGTSQIEPVTSRNAAQAPFYSSVFSG